MNNELTHSVLLSELVIISTVQAMNRPKIENQELLNWLFKAKPKEIIQGQNPH